MREKDIANIEGVLYCIKHVEEYVGEYRAVDELIGDERTYDAVMMNFVILNQSCSRLSAEVKDKNPQIDWRGINGFRNFIAHDYLGVDKGIVWTAIKEKLPELKKEFEKILMDNEGSSKK